MAPAEAMASFAALDVLGDPMFTSVSASFAAFSTVSLVYIFISTVRRPPDDLQLWRRTAFRFEFGPGVSWQINFLGHIGLGAVGKVFLNVIGGDFGSPYLFVWRISADSISLSADPWDQARSRQCGDVFIDRLPMPASNFPLELRFVAHLLFGVGVESLVFSSTATARSTIRSPRV